MLNETPETDKVWSENTMNILEWAKELERQRDLARLVAKVLKNDSRIGGKHYKNNPLPWEKKD